MANRISPPLQRERMERFMALVKAGANGGSISANMKAVGYSDYQCSMVKAGLDKPTRKAYEKWMTEERPKLIAGLRQELAPRPKVEVPRDSAGLWVKSGNPLGKPKTQSIKQAMGNMLEVKGAEAVAAVPFDIALDPTAKSGERLSAFGEIRDTLEGKPTQSVLVGHTFDPASLDRLSSLLDKLNAPALLMDDDDEPRTIDCSDRLLEHERNDLPPRSEPVEASPAMSAEAYRAEQDGIALERERVSGEELAEARKRESGIKD